VTDDELRELQELHHQLEELEKHPGWAVLEDFVLNGPKGSMSRQFRVANGRVRDWDEYQRETGWLAGAHHVLDARKSVTQMLHTELLARQEYEAVEDQEQDA
jgi:hypothetical protein